MSIEHCRLKGWAPALGRAAGLHFRRAPRRVPDMQNVYGIVVQAVENSKWIAVDGRRPDLSALGHTWRRFRIARYPVNDGFELVAD